VSLFHFVLNFLYIILSKVYLVVCTPGLLKPVTRTHETHTHVHGYGFSWRYPGVTCAIH